MIGRSHDCLADEVIRLLPISDGAAVLLLVSDELARKFTDKRFISSVQAGQ